MAVKKIGDLVLYDVEELSKLLDVQEKTIRAILRDGKLKGRKLARKWYVTEESLKDYFSQAETEIEQEPIELSGDELEKDLQRADEYSKQKREILSLAGRLQEGQW